MISPIPCVRKTNLRVRRNNFAYACESTIVRKQNKESPMCANEQNDGAQEEAELIFA